MLMLASRLKLAIMLMIKQLAAYSRRTRHVSASDDLLQCCC
jgi:hypothetical protein